MRSFAGGKGVEVGKSAGEGQWQTVTGGGYQFVKNTSDHASLIEES